MNKGIAIDGPAGAGKSTIAKAVAKDLAFVYVDTGAMYRAMAYFLISKGVDCTDADAISQVCQEADISIAYKDGEQQVLLNGENITAYLRTEEVGNMASASSVNPDVRKKLVALQQKLAQVQPVVMDGRDIGTKVLPDALLKIYLTASVEVRANRRFKELAAKGEACDLNKIQEDIRTRDERDMNRSESPLVQAEDAILVDSSNLTIPEVIDRILSLYKERV